MDALTLKRTRESGKDGLYFSFSVTDAGSIGPTPTSVFITGWATHQTATVTDVRLSSLGEVLTRSALRRGSARALDLVKLAVQGMLGHLVGESKCFFHTEISRLVLAEGSNVDLFLDLLHPDGTTSSVRAGVIADVPAVGLDLRYRERVSPILVPALGRSGTTLLMSLLSQHPMIFVPGPYPFEFRQASYLWHAARVLTAPGDFENSMHSDGFEASHRFSIGFNPYNRWHCQSMLGSSSAVQWQQRDWPIQVIDFFKEQLDQFVLNASKDSRAAEKRYVAEKALVSPLINFVSNVYPNTRRIFLVRDFRDTFCSARAFNKKRGTLSFGQGGFSEDIEWLKSMAVAARHFRNYYQAHRATSLLVLYENLITQTEIELARIFDHLDVESDPKTVKRVIDAASRLTEKGQHMTSRDPGASIGRWRADLTEDECLVAQSIFREVLEEFGYGLN